MSMVHDLTVGHLDPNALRSCAAVPLRPLDLLTVARVLENFPCLKIEERNGYVIAPLARPGRRGARRGVRRSIAGRDRVPGC